MRSPPRACPSRRSRSTSTTLTGRPSPTPWPLSSTASARSTRARAGSAAARTPRAPRATSPPRTWCGSCTGSASPRASTCRSWSTPACGWPSSWAGRARRARSPRWLGAERGPFRLDEHGDGDEHPQHLPAQQPREGGRGGRPTGGDDQRGHYAEDVHAERERDPAAPARPKAVPHHGDARQDQPEPDEVGRDGEEGLAGDGGAQREHLGHGEHQRAEDAEADADPAQRPGARRAGEPQRDEDRELAEVDQPTRQVGPIGIGHAEKLADDVGRGEACDEGSHQGKGPGVHARAPAASKAVMSVAASGVTPARSNAGKSRSAAKRSASARERHTSTITSSPSTTPTWWLVWPSIGAGPSSRSTRS